MDFWGEGGYPVIANKELDYEDTANTQTEGNPAHELSAVVERGSYDMLIAALEM